MKVLLERKWERHINCCGCSSLLRIDQDDLRMTTEESVHIVCEVCGTKTPVLNSPEYIIIKLKKLLYDKVAVDTDLQKRDD